MVLVTAQIHGIVYDRPPPREGGGGARIRDARAVG